MHRYAIATGLLRLMFPHPGNALVIGLGGGAVAREFTEYGWRVDAVEIDPLVVRVAKQYFDLRPREATIFQTDGRRYLRQHPTTYDVIVLDAYGGSSIPFHMVTREFFGLVAAHLAPDGILAVNVESRGWEDVLVRSITATLHTQFTHVLALPTGEPPNALGNVVLLAAQHAPTLDEAQLRRPFDYLKDDYLHFVVVQENHAWNNRYAPSEEGATVLTDDLNPADLWAEQINRVARKELHSYFRERAVIW